MFNTKIIDRRILKQEFKNHTETNVESSGSIQKENKNSRFININKSMQSFNTIFSSKPFYVEIQQIKNGEVDGDFGWKFSYYKTLKTKIIVEVKQVLVVGQDYTLEVVEKSKEDVSDTFNESKDKTEYFNNPTIL